MTTDARSLIAGALAAHDPWTSNSIGGGLTWHCGPCDIEEPVKTLEAGDAQVYGHWADAVLAALDGQPAAEALAGLRQELDEARAERDRMRPVVEAAEAYRDASPTSGWTNDTADRIQATERALDSAVDAYRAATPDAEPAPGGEGFDFESPEGPVRHVRMVPVDEDEPWPEVTP